MFKGFIVLALATSGVAAIVGDEVPNPPPVVNVLIEEPSYGYSEALRASNYKANEAKLAALQSMASAASGSVANLIRSNAAKLSKASSFVTTPTAPQLDAASAEKIESQLMQDCGQACIDVFHKLMEKMSGKDSHEWQDALVSMMKDEYKKVNEVYKDQLATSKLAQSFVKNKAKFNLADVPCGDAATCKIVEVIANKCEYGRVATLATYNAVNLAVHVFSVVINVLCGCVHVGPVSRCFLANKSWPTAMMCDVPYSIYVGLFKANQQIWESGVKGTTKACSMLGDFRVASPLP